MITPSSALDFIHSVVQLYFVIACEITLESALQKNLTFQSSAIAVAQYNIVHLTAVEPDAACVRNS